MSEKDSTIHYFSNHLDLEKIEQLQFLCSDNPNQIRFETISLPYSELYEEQFVPSPILTGAGCLKSSMEYAWY